MGLHRTDPGRGSAVDQVARCEVDGYGTGGCQFSAGCDLHHIGSSPYP